MKRKEALSSDINEEESGTNSNHIGNPRKMSRTDTTIVKDEKYDRQLRLWGHTGQEQLEKSNVCLLNATATGTEILKCLILPGVGKFSIVDKSIVTEQDLGNNFFLDTSSIGKPRAAATCQFLQELNDDTIGTYYCTDPIEILDNDPQFFKKFTIVIASRLSEHNLLKFGNVLWQSNIPLVLCDSFGFLGYLRVVVKEHTVVESHPDNVFQDLRLDCPFPELVDYMNHVNLDEMDKLEHSHTPFLVILHKYLEKWRKISGKKWPFSYKEKCEIKELIRGGIRRNEYDVEEIEENFEEAIKNVNSAFSATAIPKHVNEILNDTMCNHPLNSEGNSKFWILTRALKEFVNQNGVLPLRGSLPDMFSDSKRYIEIQNIYKSKATNDIDVVSEFVKEALEDLQLPLSVISSEDIKTFCKNASFLKVQQGLSLHDEYKQDTSEKKIKDTLNSVQESDVSLYLVFRALVRFLNTGRYLGIIEGCDNMEASVTMLSNIMNEIGINLKVPMDIVKELYRCDVSEIHTVAAIMGGIGAQEVIKIITKQFVLLDNTFLYNGMEQTTVSFKI